MTRSRLLPAGLPVAGLLAALLATGPALAQQKVYSGPVKPLQDEQQQSQPIDQPAAPGTVKGKKGDKFTQSDIVKAATGFFGATSEAVAKAVQKIFSENGMPDAYIKGDEGSGAIVVGLRYGSGYLMRKGYPPVKVYWQGPSVGFDFGANASKTFMLVYNLGNADRLYRRFPGVDGSFYFIAGIGVNYLRADGITIAPMRTGVGLRAGANVGYLQFTRHESYNPF